MPVGNSLFTAFLYLTATYCDVTHRTFHDKPGEVTDIKKKLNADKHSPASSARSTKRRVRGDAYVSGS